MKERGILFRDRLVRAILDGRKTQTRRLWKPHGDFLSVDAVLNTLGQSGAYMAGPHGGPGDRLWVREAWHPVSTGGVHFRADGPCGCFGPSKTGDPRWKPGIHLFRRDARTVLEIVEVRVERLQDISEEDAIAEGLSRRVPHHANWAGASRGGGLCGCRANPREAFASLWDSINASPKPVLGEDGKVDHYVSYPFDGEAQDAIWKKKPWLIRPNPFVWAITFQRVQGGSG